MSSSSSSRNKSVLATPSQAEPSSSGLNLNLSGPSSSKAGLPRNKHEDCEEEEVVVEHQKTQKSSREGHSKRMKLLKKELEYLVSTAWMYKPAESFTGN